MNHWEEEEDFISWRLERRGAAQNLPLTKHAKQRMLERDISRAQVLFALTHGRIFEGFEPYQYHRGETPFQNKDDVRSFQCVLKNGCTLIVAVALELKLPQANFSVVTTYWED